MSMATKRRESDHALRLLESALKDMSDAIEILRGEVVAAGESAEHELNSQEGRDRW